MQVVRNAYMKLSLLLTQPMCPRIMLNCTIIQPLLFAFIADCDLIIREYLVERRLNIEDYQGTCSPDSI